MNTSQLKCFLTAAECRSFTRAADRLYMSQPVLSRQIAAMEDELGMELFIREKKTIRLSPAGELMAEGLTRLNEEYQMLVEKASAVHRGFAGNLNVGMIEGQLICPPYSLALESFHEKYPNVRVNLSRHTLADLRRGVTSGDVDLGFTSLFELNDENAYDYLAVGKARTMLVIPKAHPLASKKELRLIDFQNETFLALGENESPYIAQSPDRLEKIAFRPKTLEAPDIGTLALWLEAGYGIFALNENHALRNNPNLKFVWVPEYPDVIEIVLWKKNPSNPAVALFVEQFRDIHEQNDNT